MTKQSSLRLAALLGVLAFTLISFTSAQAKVKAGSQIFQGLVEHVSTDNIKVKDPKTGQVLGFTLVPHFKNVFKGQGTAQMKDLAEGQYVKVYYDQKFLGTRHADRIYILNNANMKMGMQKG
jgi:hypothetical protein